MTSLSFSIDVEEGVLSVLPIGCSVGRSIPESTARRLLGQYRTRDHCYQADKQKYRAVHYNFKASDDAGIPFNVLLVYEGKPSAYPPLLRTAWLTLDSPRLKTNDFYESFEFQVTQHNQWMATRFGKAPKAKFKWGTIESIRDIKVEHGTIIIAWHALAQ